MSNMNKSYYFKEIEMIPLLTAEKEKALAEKAFAGSSWARNKLVEHNLRFVAKIANLYKGFMDYDDLIAEGNLGLIHAAEKFNPANGTKFTTYAVFWIKAYIQQAIRETSTGVRFPATRFEEMKKWKTISLDKPIASDEENEATFGDFICDERMQNPADEFCEKETSVQLESSLEKLKEKEMTVILKRFGLDGRKPMSLSQIGLQMGCSKETVRKIEKKALEELRADMTGKVECADLAA